MDCEVLARKTAVDDSAVQVGLRQYGGHAAVPVKGAAELTQFRGFAIGVRRHESCNFVLQTLWEFTLIH